MRSKRLFAEQALADVLVPVDRAAQTDFRVVGVDQAQPVEPDEPVDLVDGLLDAVAAMRRS